MIGADAPSRRLGRGPRRPPVGGGGAASGVKPAWRRSTFHAGLPLLRSGLEVLSAMPAITAECLRERKRQRVLRQTRRGRSANGARTGGGAGNQVRISKRLIAASAGPPPASKKWCPHQAPRVRIQLAPAVSLRTTSAVPASARLSSWSQCRSPPALHCLSCRWLGWLLFGGAGSRNRRN